MNRVDIENAAIKNIEFQGKLDLGSIIENSCRESFDCSCLPIGSRASASHLLV